MPVTTPGFLARDTFAVGSLVASTAMFPSVHVDTAFIALTVRGGTLTYRSDSGTAVTGSSGIDLPPGTYKWTITRADAKKINCIAGAGVSMDVEYYK